MVILDGWFLQWMENGVVILWRCCRFVYLYNTFRDVGSLRIENGY